MTVLQVLHLYCERQRIMCPLGVNYTIGQVSLMQMSRWSVQIPSLKMANSCRALTKRVHQGLWGNADNPILDRPLLDNKPEQEHTQDKGTEDSSWLGSYLYGIMILIGLVIQDQQDRIRYKYGYEAGCYTNLMVKKFINFV